MVIAPKGAGERFFKWDTIMENTEVVTCTNEIKHPDDFKYRLCVNTIDMEEAVGEEWEGKKWSGRVEIVPTTVSKDVAERALDCVGISYREYEKLLPKARTDVLTNALLSCGYTIPTPHEAESDDPDEVIEKLKDESPVVESLFGFYADRRLNLIGTTGWDILKEVGALKDD